MKSDNKYKLAILVFCFLIQSVFAVMANKEKIIVLDAGHGGKDKGAKVEDLQEAKINLEIAKHLKAKLESKGYKVLMTRSGDDFVSIDDRINLFNSEKNAVLALSLHVNYSSNEEHKGIEIYGNGSSAKIVSEIISELGALNEIKTVNTTDVNMRLIKDVNVPMLLMNMGFLSNAEDRKKITDKDFKEKFSEKIVNSLGNI